MLSPAAGRRACGCRSDYYDITVRDAINVPFNALNQVRACFEQSGNRDPVWIDGILHGCRASGTCSTRIRLACQSLRFAQELDANNNRIPGTRNLEDLESVRLRQAQELPADLAQGRGLRPQLQLPAEPGCSSPCPAASRCLCAARGHCSPKQFARRPAWWVSTPRTRTPRRCNRGQDPRNHTPGYRTNPITNVSEFQPNGFVSNRYTCLDLVGQIRSNVFIPGAAATPKWTGNISGTYLVGDLTATLSARYIGGAKIDNTSVRHGRGLRELSAMRRAGSSMAASTTTAADPYVNFALNGSYNLHVGNLKQFQVFGSINNLFDKRPPFTGGGISGATAQLPRHHGPRLSHGRAHEVLMRPAKGRMRTIRPLNRKRIFGGIS